MELICEKRFLEDSDIKDRWEIFNPLLSSAASQIVPYKIWSLPDAGRPRKAVFYLHGLGGSLDACPIDLEDSICPHEPLIRISCYGLAEGFGNIPKGFVATFGDVCAILHNGRQSIYTVADSLRLESYSIVAHSWGGFIGCIAGLNDTRCRKVMLLCSTPDICDAICRILELNDPIWPFAALGGLWRITMEAYKAKFGHSRYQDAWDAISPYGKISNPAVNMLIFNREEDRLMRRWNVEHFVEHAQAMEMNNVRAEFNSYSDLPDGHDMPPAKFIKRMTQFLFGE